ncbi:heparan sulfate glucosamine 3-O-sulfotransferase 2-like [Styela clava]
MASSFVQRLNIIGFSVVSSKKNIDFNRRMWIAAFVFVAFILLLIMYGNYVMNQPKRGVMYEEKGWIKYEIKEDSQKTSEERDRDKLLVEYEAAKRTLAKIFQKILMHTINATKTFEQLADDLFLYSANLNEKMNMSGWEMLYIEQLKKEKITNHILTTGLYYYHLLRWYIVFNMSDIYVVDGEELISNPAKVIKEVQDFLHIPEFVLPENIRKGPSGFYCFAKPLVVERNGVLVAGTARTFCMTGKGRTRKGAWGVANPKYMEKLRSFFAPFNEKLYKLLGRRFNW